MSILSENKIIMNGAAKDKYEAITMAGKLLVDAGHVTEEYVPKMLEREEVVSTYMGEGLPFRTVRRKQDHLSNLPAFPSSVFRTALISAGMSLHLS